MRRRATAILVRCHGLYAALVLAAAASLPAAAAAEGAAAMLRRLHQHRGPSVRSHDHDAINHAAAGRARGFVRHHGWRDDTQVIGTSMRPSATNTGWTRRLADGFIGWVIANDLDAGAARWHADAWAFRRDRSIGGSRYCASRWAPACDFAVNGSFPATTMWRPGRATRGCCGYRLPRRGVHRAAAATGPAQRTRRWLLCRALGPPAWI